MEKNIDFLSGVRFTGQCVCGAKLELAHHPQLERTFWNCFVCFPMYPRAAKEQEESFLKEFKLERD